MNKTAPNPTTLSWIILMLLGVIWGASFMGAKVALTGFGPMTVAAGRLVIGAVLLLAVSMAKGHGIPPLKSATDKRIWLAILGMGFFTNALPFTLLNWGQLYVSSGFAGITMSVVPLLVLPLVHVLVPGEQMNLRKLIGFGIGFIGVLVLIGPSTLFSSTGADLEPIARLACIIAACCYAIGSIITRLCPPIPTFPYAAAGLTVGAIMMVPMALCFEGAPSVPDARALAGLIYLGVFPTAIATLLLVYVINSAGPSFLSLVNYQVPVWAVIFGVVLLGEGLPSQFIAALGLILLGLLISQWFTVQRIFRRG